LMGAHVPPPATQSTVSLAQRLCHPTRASGAANTFPFAPEGAISAENTAAPGLIAALPCAPRGLRALVLGAGGGARAAVWALRREGAVEVAVWNRTLERAQALARDLGARAVRAPEPAALPA